MTSRSHSDWQVLVLSYAVLTLALAIIALPLLNLLAVSLSGEAQVISGNVTFLPKDAQLQAYQYVLRSARFYKALYNSILLTVIGTLVSMFATCLAAYALSREALPGRRLIMYIFIFCMLFNGGIIPTYLLIMQLKLLNTLWAIVFPMAVNVYNLLIIKNYMEGLPVEIEEAARIDGARQITLFFRVILPLSTPVLATIGLFYAVGFWNEYFTAKMYLSSANKILLQTYLQAVIFDASDPSGAFRLDASLFTNLSNQSLINATVICSMLPICILYPFLQRYFVSGIVLGSVKG